MGRNSSGAKPKLRKGLWSPEEDEKLYNHITRFGVGCWSSVPKLAGLQRCGKSCRLRWINYLRPDLKRGMFSQQEEDLIINLHEALGNRWAQIAAQLPGRTDNEIKNFWNSSLKKKLLKQGVDPSTHKVLIKDEREMMMQEGIPTSSSAMQQNYNLATKSSIKELYDHHHLFELESSLDSHGFTSSFCDILRPYENDPINPISGFNSMPNLTNFDHQSLAETEFLNHSSSRMSKFAMNEGLMQMNGGNGGALPWDDESKVDAVFQFEFSGIQIEESKSQSVGDFAAYALPQNMNVFDHRM